MYIRKKANRETYADRNKSYLIVEMMDDSGLSRKDIARVLGISVQYFCNKLTRNSFSFDDIIKISKACGYEIRLYRPGTYPITIEL